MQDLLSKTTRLALIPDNSDNLPSCEVASYVLPQVHVNSWFYFCQKSMLGYVAEEWLISLQMSHRFCTGKAFEGLLK